MRYGVRCRAWKATVACCRCAATCARECAGVHTSGLRCTRGYAYMCAAACGQLCVRLRVRLRVRLCGSICGGACAHPEHAKGRKKNKQQKGSKSFFFPLLFAPAVLGSRVGPTVRAHRPAALGARRATPPAAAPDHPPRRTTAPAARAAFARVRAVPPMTRGNATAG